MNAAFCSMLFTKYCKWDEKKEEQREDVHLGLGRDLNLGPLEWQPRVLTTTPCHIHCNLVVSYTITTFNWFNVLISLLIYLSRGNLNYGLRSCQLTNLLFMSYVMTRVTKC